VDFADDGVMVTFDDLKKRHDVQQDFELHERRFSGSQNDFGAPI